jgi:hypothetical protein
VEWVKRRAGLLLGSGLVLGLGWTAAVTASMPDWYDPSEACRLKLGGYDDPGGSAEVHTGWFPPSASCDFGNGPVQYMSTTRSVLLSVGGVLILIVLVTGLVLTVRRFTSAPGVTTTADGVNLRRRMINQLTFGALDVAVVVAVLTFCNAAAIIFGGLPGGILFAIATIAGLSALGVVLDRHLGPLPSTTLDSRRRGAVAGVTVFGVIFVATALTGQLPFFRLWSVPVGAIAYAAVVAVQWSRQRANKASPAQYSG